jgi:hypothetical protein
MRYLGMHWGGYDERAGSVLESAVALARSSGSLGSLHLLIAISNGEGPAAEALRQPTGAATVQSPISRNAAQPNWGVSFDYRARQVVASACNWASEAGALASPEHLLVALAEQASSDVVSFCTANGIDLDQAGARARQALGWSATTARSLQPLTAAGVMDRPPLPVAELPADVWATLCGRQRRLPLSRLRRPWQCRALQHNEQRAVSRIAQRIDLSDDERCSLLQHHDAAVGRLVAEAVPELVPN